MMIMAAKKKKGEETPEEAAAETAAAPAEEAKKARKPRAKKEKTVFTRGKRKEAVARASVKKGSGNVRINRFSVWTLGNRYLRSMITEPLLMAGEAAKAVDIDVSVYGGGSTAQAEAVRMAIARGLAEFTGDEELKKRMLEYDRYLLSEDSRRVEPKKYKGPKARARFQKSYR